VKSVQQKILLVTETPPGTPNGFGVTLQCMLQNTPHDVLYTDAAYSAHGEKEGHTLAQVPFHRSKKYFIRFMLGRIPEWREKYSARWLRKNLQGNHSKAYGFVYSVDCLLYVDWIAKQRNMSLLVHLADHSEKFEQHSVAEILRNCSKLICITKEMKSKYQCMLGRKDIDVLHNGAEDRCVQIAPPSPPPFGEKNPFILCFLGGLFSHLHGDCIEDIFEAFSQIRKQIPWIEFHLYGQRQPKGFLDEQLKQPGVTHHGIVMPLEKKYSIMERAHCFVVPSSFNLNNHRHYRFSFPTKLPEIIVSGRSIISYGPSDTSTNRLLESHKIGTGIYNRSVKELVLSLTNMVNRYTEIDTSSNNSLTGEIFSAKRIREKFYKIINDT
jgi:glycosyltransferase involved in cell wall biosynthesis